MPAKKTTKAVEASEETKVTPKKTTAKKTTTKKASK